VTIAGASVNASSGYAPAIDGLRAVSILLVFSVHANSQWAPGGAIGVDIFFVISGYLITGVLLDEYSKCRGISIKNFYLRRMLRVGPAFAFLLLVYLALSFTFVAPDHRGDHLRAIFYSSSLVMNWTRAFGLPSGMIGHTWSLSVEEQFYLVWPLIFAALVVGSRRKLIFAIAAFVLIGTLWRMWLALQADAQGRIFFGSDTRANQIFVGCLLALVPMQAISRLAARTWLVPAAALGTIVAAGTTVPRWFDLVGSLIVALSAAWLIAAVRSAQQTTLSRILGAGVCVAMGRLSYSFYLWHLPIIVGLAGRSIVTAETLPFVAFLLSLTAAAFSYFVIEKPFLRMKVRYSAGRDTSSASLLSGQRTVEGSLLTRRY